MCTRAPSARRCHVGVHVVVRRALADEQDVHVLPREAATASSSSGIRFSGVMPPNAPIDAARLSGIPMTAAHLLTVSGALTGRRVGDAHLDMADRRVGVIAREAARQVRVVDDRQLRRADGEGDERPMAKELSAESGGKQMAEMRWGVRMIGASSAR